MFYCPVASAEEFPLYPLQSDFLPPVQQSAARFQASQVLRRASTAHRQFFPWTQGYWYLPEGSRRLLWANTIFELFSKMTALAPSEVFISGHFKTLNLSKADCFTLSRRPLFLPVLTTQITCCSTLPVPCHPARHIKFRRWVEEDSCMRAWRY